MTTTHKDNPDHPAMPGEIERDNNALRPNDPAKRKQEKGHPDGGETDAQKVGRKDGGHKPIPQ